MTTATQAGSSIELRTEGTRGNTRAGMVLVALMPLAIALTIAALALWLTPPLR